MKPGTDEERRAWLRLSKLQSERDRLAHERDLLRSQLHAAISAGSWWTGVAPQAIELQLRETIQQWRTVVAEITGKPTPEIMPDQVRSDVIGTRIR